MSTVADVLRVTYIGEPVAAMGFALAGAVTHLPPVEAEQVWSAFLAARNNSDLVLLNHAHARVIEDRLGTLLREQPVPPVLVLPSMDTDEPFTRELTRDARRLLGLAQAEG